MINVSVVINININNINNNINKNNKNYMNNNINNNNDDNLIYELKDTLQVHSLKKYKMHHKFKNDI